MKWLALHIDTSPAGLEPVETMLSSLGIDGLVIEDEADFRRFLELTSIHDYRRLKVYVLVNYNSTHEQDLYRVDTLRAMGYDPYVMVYDRPSAPLVTLQLQRWVNNKRIFRVVPSFADYVPNKRGGAAHA